MYQSVVHKALVVTLLDEELLERQISMKINVNVTRIHQAIKKFYLYSSYKGLKKSGRPRNLGFESST